jgi:hypothetical protein|tara:strand:+ start:3634 stop:3786 length:153 start_codon:yes stop_codon:yes gene_type:complete
MLLLKADTQQSILFFVFPLKKEAKQISSFGRLLRVKSILDKTTDEAKRIK